MFFDELMFEHLDQLKLEVFHSITTVAPGDYPLQYFATNHSLTYHQVSRIFTLIDEDMTKVEKDWQPLMAGNGKILIATFPIKLDAYRNMLWEKTVTYQFIETVFSGKKVSVNDFCEKLKMGRSTLYRKMVPMIEFLSEYDIKISYHPLDFIGDEALIRIIFSYLFWIGKRGVNIPSFANEELANLMVSRHEIVGHKVNSYIGEKQLFNSLYISNARVLSGHFVDKKAEWTEIFSKSPLFESKVLKDLKEIPYEKKQDEIYFYFFYIFILHSYSNGDGEESLMKKILDTFVTQQDEHPVTIIVREFLSCFNQDSINVSDEELTVLTVNLLSITYGYYVFNKSIPDLESLTFPLSTNNKEYQQLYEKCSDFFEEHLTMKDYERLLTSEKEMVRRFTNMVYPYMIQFDAVNKLQVGVAIENNPIIENNLKVFLKRLNFVESESFQSSKASEYDVVIHTSSVINEDFPELQHSYLWDIGFGEKEIFWLYTTLHHHYIEKQDTFD